MEIINELEVLTQKIERNTATLTDYDRYENLLQKGGLTHNYIYSYLNRAGFNTWDEFLQARKQKKNDQMSGALVGGIIGLGIGLLLMSTFGDKD